MAAARSHSTGAPPEWFGWRLVDLSPRGMQPIWSADRRVAVLFNGEIYNFRAQRERLSRSGIAFHTGTDTEVILQLYLENREEFVDRLRGMFAIAIFDWRERRPAPCRC